MSSRGSRWIVRLPVLIATTVAMAVSLPLMYFMIASIHSRNDLRAGVAENMSIARIISSEAAGGESNHFLSSVEHLLMGHDHYQWPQNGRRRQTPHWKPAGESEHPDWRTRIGLGVECG
jgi:hypothetical protein